MSVDQRRTRDASEKSARLDGVIRQRLPLSVAQLGGAVAHGVAHDTFKLDSADLVELRGMLTFAH